MIFFFFFKQKTADEMRISDWSSDVCSSDLNIDHIRAHRRLIADHRGTLTREALSRVVHRVAKAAGIGHVTPHQLRHTLATQAINRGMRLEAIAALLGHRTMHMTLPYARIPDRVVPAHSAAAPPPLAPLPVAPPHSAP